MKKQSFIASVFARKAKQSPRSFYHGDPKAKPSRFDEIASSALKGILAMTMSVLLFIGCEDQPTEVEDYDPQPVLQGYLVNGQPVDRIYLQWVAPIYGYYDVTDYGIADADMKIYAVGSQDTLHLTQDPDSSWIYKPMAGESLIPESRSRYAIKVVKADENIDLYSEALMPGTFPVELYSLGELVQSDTLDTLTRNDPNLFFTWEEADSAGGYNLNVTCLTPKDSLLWGSMLPLDPDFDPEEDDLDPEDIQLSEFWPMRYDQRELVVPWFIFHYEGWHRIELQAITSDYYDYGMSIFRQEAGMPVQLAGNINGGIGIFGALSTNVYWVYMKRVE